jgi:mRNA-degrading endonuclease RelE of RelBE toxin-antitoxin system
MPILPILSGKKATLLWAAGASGRFRAKEYFDKLDATEKAKFDALFRRMAEIGTIKNIELFRKESENIYCFKRGQYRLACYREGNRLMLVHGFRKKSDKGIRLKREIQTADRIRTEHLERTQGKIE